MAHGPRPRSRTAARAWKMRVAGSIVVLAGCEGGVNQSQRHAAAERRLDKIESRLEVIADQLANVAPGSAGGTGSGPLEQRIDDLEARMASFGSEGGPATGDSGQAMQPPDRRHGILIDCGGASPAPSNPFGLAGDQWRSAAAARDFFRAGYERASRLYQRHGSARIVWRRLAGSTGDDKRGDMAVLAAMDGRQFINDAWSDRHPWRRRIFIDETAKFLAEHPGATVGVSMSALVPRSWQSVDDSISQPAEPFDAASHRHRLLAIDQVARPLAAIGVTEIWLEDAAEGESREGAIALASALARQFAMHCVIRDSRDAAASAVDESLVRRLAVAVSADMASAIPAGARHSGEVIVVVTEVEVAGAVPADRLRPLLDSGCVIFASDQPAEAALRSAIEE